MKKPVLVFIVICAVGLLSGGIMAECTFGGIITLAGFYFIMEFVRPLKWIIYHYGRLLDIILFFFTIYATVSRGVTIALSLTIAAIGYTTVLVPYVKQTYYLKQ